MGQNKVICNSSPLINLSKVGKLSILQKLFRTIIIPVAVYNELINDVAEKEGSNEIAELIKNKVIIIKEVNDKNLVKALRNDLDYGESEVIALALEIGADLLIIDELDARKKAELYNLPKTGFIGLLIKAHSLKYIDNFIELLDIAIEKGFWINRKLYQRIINDFTDK